MTAYEYICFCKNVADTVYKEINKQDIPEQCKDCTDGSCWGCPHQRIPIVGTYYMKDVFGGKKPYYAFMHPDDNGKDHEDLKYYYSDI